MGNFAVGLDLGQSQDFTALAILEQLPGEEGYSKPVYHIRHLERLPLGTPYPAVIEKVTQIIEKKPLKDHSSLVLDVTGCGKPVYDMFVDANLYPIGIYIHGGDTVTRDGSIFRVPKRDLISALQVLFQTKRLKIASKIPEAKTFIEELLNFKVKINVKTAHDSYEAWREGIHDDLVLAVAMAAWYAEKFLSTSESFALLPGDFPGEAQFDFNTEEGQDEWEDEGFDDDPGFF